MNITWLSVFGLALIVIHTIPRAEAVSCYQCSSDQDEKGEDNCGAYESFDTEKNVPVDCQSLEAVTSGFFCVKTVKQGPRGFIWDGRWRQVIRRCASVAETGVTEVCNWGIDDNNVYWENCYCSQNGCNHAHSNLTASLPVFILSLLLQTISSA